MTLLYQALEEKKFDVRMKENNIARGFATTEEAEKVEQTLSDEENLGDWVNVDELRSSDA